MVENFNDLNIFWEIFNNDRILGNGRFVFFDEIDFEFLVDLENHD
jgi:hypothetical protein